MTYNLLFLPNHRLVLTSCGLTSFLRLASNISIGLSYIMTCEGLIAYKLVQIPATYLHVTLVIIQTCGESLGVGFTAPCSPIALVSRIGGLGRNRGICSLGFGRAAARTSAKKSSDGVTDRRANCYTTAKDLIRQNGMAKQCDFIRYSYH